jgi:hypothetical protein
LLLQNLRPRPRQVNARGQHLLLLANAPPFLPRVSALSLQQRAHSLVRVLARFLASDQPFHRQAPNSHLVHPPLPVPVQFLVNGQPFRLRHRHRQVERNRPSLPFSLHSRVFGPQHRPLWRGIRLEMAHPESPRPPAKAAHSPWHNLLLPRIAPSHSLLYA